MSLPELVRKYFDTLDRIPQEYNVEELAQVETELRKAVGAPAHPVKRTIYGW